MNTDGEWNDSRGEAYLLKLSYNMESYWIFLNIKREEYVL